MSFVSRPVGSCTVGTMINPHGTVLTQHQEKEMRVNGPNGWTGLNWNGKGTHMWRLKQEKPELFESKDKAFIQQLAEQTCTERMPQGFEPCASPGWLYNKDLKIYYQKVTRKRFWFDEVGQQTRPLYEGQACPVTLAGGAAAAPGTKAAEGADSATAAASSSAPRPTAPKHIIISDIHAAAKAMKMDFGHLDRPAGALAVIGASSSSTAAPDAVARSLPEKLLRRLAGFRSEWSDDMISTAIQNALADVAAGFGGARLNAAVALVLGQRVVAVAAAPTAQVFTAVHRGEAGGTAGAEVASPGEGETCASLCRHLGEDSSETLVVGLAAGEPAAIGFEALVPHAAQGRPRAASIAQLRAMRRQDAKGPIAIASARLSHEASASSSADAAAASAAFVCPALPPLVAGQPAAKRPKTEEPSGKKVRIRQVLLRHASVAAARDPVRGRPVARSLEEAEEQMLSVLDDLLAEKGTSFPGVCKAISECQSARKGSEFAGDVGWLDSRRSASTGQQKDQKSLRVQLPSGVLKAAFELAVGELSDILTSDQGVHLLQRTA